MTCGTFVYSLVSSINKTDCYDITEILLKKLLRIINLAQPNILELFNQLMFTETIFYISHKNIGQWNFNFKNGMLVSVMYMYVFLWDTDFFQLCMYSYEHEFQWQSARSVRCYNVIQLWMHNFSLFYFNGISTLPLD